MRFSLKLLMGVMTYIGAVLAVCRYFSSNPLRLPILPVNFGLLRYKTGTHLHDIELIVWLPVIILVTVSYFRLVTATGKRRLRASIHGLSG